MNSQTSFSARRVLAATTGLLGLTMAFYGTPAEAQQSEIDVLRQQILELQNRLNTLEDSQKKTASSIVAPSVSSKTKVPITISGLVQMHYLSSLDDDRSTAPDDTFRFRRGELRIDAPKITDKISGSIMFDFAKTSANGNASSTTAVGTERNSTVQEYRLSYDINKTANSSNTLDLGQFKIPFGYEGDQVSSSALQTVERALFFRTSLSGVSSALRTGGDQRDQGVRLRGTSGQFYYDLGVFNGLGERQNSNDFDSNKAIAARVGFSPKSVPGLNVGVSYANGALDNLVFPNGAADPTSVDRNLYNAYAAYKRDKFTAQAEYFNVKAEGDNGVERKANSYYGSLGYLFTPKLEGVVRYDSFDGNSDADNATTKESTIGLNYYLKGNNAKVQANVVKVDRPTSGGASQDSLELRTNFQIAF